MLLTNQRPLYGFLARHAPRVAIDVQREYVGRARLYFETGFRRYTRALAGARDRARKREGGGLIGEIVKNSTGGESSCMLCLPRENQRGAFVAACSYGALSQIPRQTCQLEQDQQRQARMQRTMHGLAMRLGSRTPSSRMAQRWCWPIKPRTQIT